MCIMETEDYFSMKGGKNMSDIIITQNLCKSFKEVRAVNNLSFRVKEGELFAFLGVNGAGKSTTISMLCGQLKKDSGEITIGGMKPSENMDSIKQMLGVVFQNSALDKQLSVMDNLKCRAALYGITGKKFSKRLDEVSRLLDLSPLLKRQVGKLSGGQRRRIDIARAIFHKPKLLILDEPTTGLDPQTRKNVWEVVDALRKKENLTVFLTTHYMEEAAEADYVVILDSGEISAEGTPLELKNKYTGDFITLYGCSENEALKAAWQYPVEKLGLGYRIAVPDTEAATRLILANPQLFRDYEIAKGRMDDVFLAATGKNMLFGENV